MIVNYNLYI